MKTSLSIVVALLASLSFTGPVRAGHVPSIEVKIDGNAAQHVRPQLVLNDENKNVDMYLYDGRYLAEDAVAGSYTLTLVDEDYGTVLLVEGMTVKESGHHLMGNTRHIECAFHDGAIDCRNYY
ncbi:hypothetical protein EON77_16135 [bacterium]|nr:MAG: hypothetical protein EON77_16135 [bacterium]